MAVIIAELVPQFDLVMGIIGGTLTGPLIFILPPLFYCRLIRMERDFDERNERDTINNAVSETNFGDDETILNDHDQQQRQQQQQKPYIDSYGTFTKQPKPIVSRSSWLFCFCNDSLLCICVIIFGIIVTITSTYFNLLTASNFDEFRSPCIQNISLSFGEL